MVKQMSRRRRKKKDFSKKIVTMVLILNILFTAAVLYTFLKVGSEPMTLIGCWFAFTTGELWMLSSIKKTKVRKDGNDDQD
jgi:hypothetical protein